MKEQLSHHPKWGMMSSDGTMAISPVQVEVKGEMVVHEMPYSQVFNSKHVKDGKYSFYGIPFENSIIRRFKKLISNDARVNLYRQTGTGYIMEAFCKKGVGYCCSLLCDELIHENVCFE